VRTENLKIVLERIKTRNDEQLKDRRDMRVALIHRLEHCHSSRTPKLKGQLAAVEGQIARLRGTATKLAAAGV
jgi:hypothetical protein